MLHRDNAGAVSKFAVSRRYICVIGKVSLPVMEGVSLAAELHFDFSELAVVVVVRRTVCQRVVVGALFSGGGDGFADAIGAEESFAASGRGHLVKSVAFSHLLIEFE